MERFTDLPTIICTLLSFLIPFTIYKINKNISRNTNPPWKKDIE